MKLAMKSEAWLGCAGHNLNLVLSHSLREQHVDEADLQDEEQNFMRDVMQLIAVCKKTVANARSCIQAKLQTSLKQAVVTRWNSMLTMLQSVLCNADGLKKLADEFADKTLQRLLLDINTDLLKQVINVLEPFDVATRMLSTDRAPSLHLVYPTKVQLTNKLQPESGDGTVILQLKSLLLSKLGTLYHVKPLHCLATMLDPRLKSGILSAKEKLEATAALRELTSQVPVTTDDTEAANTEPSAKRRKLAV